LRHANRNGKRGAEDGAAQTVWGMDAIPGQRCNDMMALC
jgi:hypothetical protein